MADNLVELDFNNASLLKTGQTADLTPAGRTCKDDGGEQRGEARNYTILTTGQYSGTTAIIVNGKTDTHSNECVVDNVTNLLWSRTTASSVGPASDGLLYWDDTGGLGEDIFAYCDQANLASLTGYTDWRIPNINELYSIIKHLAGSAPYVDQVAFPTMVSGLIWSSTSRADNTLLALGTYTSLTAIPSSVKTTATNSCLLVRN